MKSPYNLFFSLLILSLFICNTTSSHVLLRIPISGLIIESCTFSTVQTTENTFHIQQGIEIMAHYPFLKPESRNRLRAKWFPALKGKSLPGGGIVNRKAYELLMKKNLNQLKKPSL